MAGYGIIGFGRIGQRLASRLPGAVVLTRPARLSEAEILAGRGKACVLFEEFVACKPAVAIECASPQALKDFGPALLAAGIDLVPLSLTALADPATEQKLMAAAAAGPGRLEIAPGAIGTLDLLASAREAGLERVVYRQIKSPAMWKLTPAVAFADLAAVSERRVFLKGSVRELATRLPDNLNSSVGVALAGLGLDATQVELVADPAISQTAHELEIHSAPGKALLRLGGRDVTPDGDPVDYTTFSLLRLLRRRGAKVAI